VSTTVVRDVGEAADVEVVLDRCRQLVSERRSTLHPFVTELSAHAPGRDALGQWATQKYCQVFLQNAVFSAIHMSAAEHEDVRQYAMSQLIAEETSLCSGSAAHYELMRRFALACRVDEAQLDARAAAGPVRQWVDELVRVARDQGYVFGLLAVWAIESQSGPAAARLLAWLRDNTDFCERQLEWFVVHAEEEDDHAIRALNLIRAHAGANPKFAKLADQVIESVCNSWAQLHDFYLNLIRVGPVSDRREADQRGGAS
jgi:pyrroloquinoline-quinone synthase